MIEKPNKVGLSDPKVRNTIQGDLIKARAIARGTRTVAGGNLILPKTTVTATTGSGPVTATTSNNNSYSDTVTVYNTNNAVYVSSITENIRNSTVSNNSVINNYIANTGNVTFNNVTMQGTGNIYLKGNAVTTNSYAFSSTGTMTFPDGTQIKTAAIPQLLVMDELPAGVVTSYQLGTNAQLPNFAPDGPALPDPWKIVTDTFGFVYANDNSNQAVYKYSATGACLGAFIQSGPTVVGIPPLDQVVDMQFDQFGNYFYVAANGVGNEFYGNNPGVLQFDAVTGEYIDLIIQGGLGNDLNDVQSMVLSADGNYIFLAGFLQNGGGYGVQRYSITGLYIEDVTPFVNFMDMSNPWAMTVDATGDLYVGNMGLNGLALAGAVSPKLSGKAKINAVNNALTALGATTNTGNVLKFNGVTNAFISEFIPTLGSLINPTELLFASDGLFYVTDSTQNSVYQFPAAGGVETSTITAGVVAPWGMTEINQQVLTILGNVDSPIVIETQSSAGDTFKWGFNPDGTLSLPGNSYSIYNANGTTIKTSVNVFQKNQSVKPYQVTLPASLPAPYTYTIDASLSNNFMIWFSVNLILASPINATSGMVLNLQLVQDGAVSTVTWPANFTWPNSTAPTVTSTSGAIDFISMYYDGVNNVWRCVASQNFGPGA